MFNYTIDYRQKAIIISFSGKMGLEQEIKLVLNNLNEEMNYTDAETTKIILNLNADNFSELNISSDLETIIQFVKAGLDKFNQAQNKKKQLVVACNNSSKLNAFKRTGIFTRTNFVDDVAEALNHK